MPVAMTIMMNLPPARPRRPLLRTASPLPSPPPGPDPVRPAGRLCPPRGPGGGGVRSGPGGGAEGGVGGERKLGGGARRAEPQRRREPTDAGDVGLQDVDGPPFDQVAKAEDAKIRLAARQLNPRPSS